MNVEQLENFLNQNKPSKVVAALKTYKGKDAEVLYLLGEAQRMLGSFEPAITTYIKAAANAAAAETKMEILLSLAACERTLGRAESAFHTAAAVEVLAEGLEYEGFKIEALQEMGMALRAQGKLQQALEYLNEVLAHYVSEADFGGISFILWAKGGIFRLQGHLPEGIKTFKDSIKYAKKAGDKINEAYALCGLAGISRIAGDLKACVNNYKAAYKIFAKTEDVFGKAYTNCGLANGLRQQGLYAQALKYYHTADKLYSAIGDKVDLGFVKWGRAEVYKKQNRLNDAAADLKAAEKLFSGSDEKRGQILTMLSTAQVLYALGRTDEAKVKYDDGVALAKKEGLNTYLEIYT